jgi:hypothetical protein
MAARRCKPWLMRIVDPLSFFRFPVDAAARGE